MEGKGKMFLTGAILGAALGSAAAMLFCTKSGKKLKDKMMKNIDLHELLEMGAEKLGIDPQDVEGLFDSKTKHKTKKTSRKKSKK